VLCMNFPACSPVLCPAHKKPLLAETGQRTPLCPAPPPETPFPVQGREQWGRCERTIWLMNSPEQLAKR